MNSAESIENELKNLKLTTSPDLDRRILHDSEAVLEATASAIREARPSAWRSIMKSHWTKLTTVAAAIAIAVISLTVFNRTAVPVYAVEQTLAANKTVRHVHVRIDPPGTGLAEAWAQFDNEGKPLQLRLEFPNTEDGPKITIWRQDKAEVWFKAKNSHLIVNEPMAVSRLRQVFDLFDPRLGFESAAAAQARGVATLEIQSPAQATQPIILTLTAKPNGEWREVYAIDPVSKCVSVFEKFQMKETEYERVARFEYDYPEEFEAGVFALDLPADITQIDQTAQEIGVPRDGLSDQDLAAKTAREYFEALIAEDFAAAGRIMEGFPGEKLRELVQVKAETKFVRIVSVGSPTPHPDPRTEFLVVPCEVEMQVRGASQTKTFKLNIRHAYNQPDRFVVGGGF